MNRILFYLPFCLFYYYISGYSQKSATELNTNKISVPIPWTPLQIKKQNQIINIECWGRKYVFDHSLFPSQIYSREIPLLSKPINLILSLDDKTLELDTASVKVTLNTSAVIELEATSKLKDPQFKNVEIKTKIHAEYDGLMLLSLTINSTGNFKSPSSSINISYNDNVSKYYVSSGENTNYSGGLPSKNGLLLNSGFTPYFWLGDNYRGLFWFCEGTQNWPNAQSSGAIQIVRQGNEIKQKFDLGSINFYQFGIQATPVKPLPDNWRNLRLFPANDYNVFIPLPKPNNSFAKYLGWPEAKNDNDYNTLIKNIMKKKRWFYPML